MSLVTITTPSGETVSAELQCKRDLRLPAGGNAGQASFTVPRSNALANVLSPDGLDLVLIHDGATGDWLGIITTVKYSDDGIAVTAIQPWGLMGRRIVKRSDTVTNVWPGYLAGIAMDAATVAGMAQQYPVMNGDTPMVARFSFNYSDAWGVLQSLMDQSDGELNVDAATGRMDWCGQLAYANAYGPMLIAGESLRDWSYESDATDEVSEVLGTFGNGNAYTATYADTAAHHWPAQAVVNGGSEREARELAEQELSRRMCPVITISGSVTYDHAAIRERDYVQVFVPQVRNADRSWGRTHTCRVLARSVDDGDVTIKLELQVMPDESTMRTPVPGRGSKAGGRGFGPLGVRLLRLSRIHG